MSKLILGLEPTVADGRIFKIRCSQISKIMGRIGLTEAQLEKFEKYRTKPTPLTENQKEEFAELKEKKENASSFTALPQTCKSYLHNWYANDQESLSTPEINKGNFVESDLIEFMCDVLNLGIAEKNQERRSDDFLEGECDVYASHAGTVVDTKAPFDRESLHSKIVETLPVDYEWQGIGYCHLWNAKKFILFYGLMDTPAEVNYDKEVIYSTDPIEQRWIAYETTAKPEMIEQVKERVKMCRLYLEYYDKIVRSSLGKLKQIN